MIRNIRPEDREAYLAMSDAFYHSEAVLHPVPLEVQARVSMKPFLQMFIWRFFSSKKKAKLQGMLSLIKVFLQKLAAGLFGLKIYSSNRNSVRTDWDVHSLHIWKTGLPAR